MLSDLFQSKHRRKINRWKKEHIKMVELAHKVLGEYGKGEQTKAKKYLKEFSNISMDHIVSEEIAFFKLLHRDAETDRQTEKLVEEFTKSFGDTKETLTKFLAKYTALLATLDEEFFDTFNAIVKILGERIEYEENNLYLHMSLS